MEATGNKNDWFIANIMSPDNTFADFEQEGLNNDNIELLGREAYKSNEKVKSAFTNAEGKFDNDKYDSFYDVVVQTYNKFSTDNYDKTVMNNDYFGQHNIFVGDKAKKITKPFVFSKEKNAFGDVQGIVGPMSKVESEFTVRELAQTQKIFDTESGEFKNITPNDEGFLGAAFGKNTQVLAQYDEDGIHYDMDLGKDVQHFKGEYKLNDAGKPFYETLNGREVYGKQVLSPWDVLTVDGSMADKWNFMSGDDRKKTITGNVMRAAAFAAPYFIPGVGQYYTAATIGAALVTDLLPVLTKSTFGIFLNDRAENSELYKRLNSLQGVGARFAPSQSDESTQSILNLDNVAVMMSDVFGQLAQQRGIAKIPTWLGLKRKEAQAFSMAMKGKTPEQLTELSRQFKQVKGAQLQDKFLRENFGQIPGIPDMLRKWDLWSSEWSRNLGVAYMAGISATGIHEESKLNGLDERDAAAMFLGSVGAFGWLMNSNPFARWALEGIGIDEAGQFAKETIRKAVKDNANLATGVMSLDDVSKAALNLVADVGEEAVKKPSGIFRNMGDSILGAFKKLNTGPYNTIGEKGLSEAVEEITEEGIQDALKFTYNAMNYVGLVSSEKAQNFEFDEALSRYVLAGLGGFAGGAIVGIQDNIGGRVHSSLPDGMKSEFVSMLIHGYENELRESLKQQYDKGLLGSTTLSPLKEPINFKLGADVVYKSKEDGKMSQNDFIYGVLNAQIDFLKKVIFQEGALNLKYAMNYALRDSSLIDLGYTTPIQNDINDIVKKIADVKAEIAKLQGAKDTTKEKEEDNQEAVSALEAQLKPLQDGLKEILQGERNLEYTEKALFGTNRALYTNYGVKDLNKVAQELYRKNFENLSEDQKAEATKVHQEYVESEKRHQLSANFLLFKKDLEITIPNVEVLDKYAQQTRALIEGLYNPEDVLTKLESINVSSNMEEIAGESSTQASEIVQNDLNPIEVTPDPTDPDGRPLVTTKPLGPIDLLKKYVDYSKKVQHINPLLDNYIKQRFNTNFNLSIDYDGIKIKDLDALFSRTSAGVFDSFVNIKFNNLIQNKLKALDLKITNLATVKEKLAEGLVGIFNNPTEIDEFVNSFSIGEAMAMAGYGSMEPEMFTYIKKTLDEKVKELAGFLNYDSATITTIDGEPILDVTGSTTEIQEMADLYNQYLQNTIGKSKSPLHELVAQFAEVDSQEGVKYLFDSINEIFEDLERNSFANQFILNENVSKQQLERALAIIDRVDGTLMASTNFKSKGPIVGYNEALNTVEQLNLPTMESEEYSFLSNEISNIKQKIYFLLNLSQFNSGGTIREQKHLAVRLIALNLEALKIHVEPLKQLGLGLNDVIGLYEDAKAYKTGLSAIRSDEIPNYDDKSYTALRIEEAKIRQAFYEAVNKDDNTKEIFTKYFNTLGDLNGTFIENSELNSNIKALTEYQQLMYIAKSANLEVRKFLSDYYGEIDKGDEFLKNQSFSPFYSQELVSENIYWSVFSKYNSLDSYKIFSEKVLPKYDVALGDRKSNLKNHEKLNSIFNAIFIDGIPGSGKTSAIIKFIQNALSKNGLNTAVFAPIAQQSENIMNSLVTKESIMNPANNLVTDLFNAISPTLHQAIEESIQNKNYKSRKDLTESDLLYHMSTTTEKDGDYSLYSIQLNQNSKQIKEFKNNFKELLINGKIPSVIIIDEATNISSTALELLSLAIELHNDNHVKPEEKIALILAGDTEQSGYSTEIVNSKLPLNLEQNLNIIRTPKLSSSLRAGNNLILENVTLLRTYNKTTVDILEAENEVLDKSLTLKFIDKEDGLYGHKQLDNLDEPYILNQVRANLGKTVLITDKQDSDILKILTKNFGEADFSVKDPSQIQGSEYEFVILDLKPTSENRPLNAASFGPYLTKFTNIYTLLTRSKKATLFTKDSIPTDIINITTSDQNVFYKNIRLDESLLNKYKQFNFEAVKHLLENLKPVDTAYKIEVPTGKKEVLLDGEGTELIFNAIANQLNSDPEHSGKAIVDEAGNVVTSDYEDALVYVYHEHLGFSVDKDGRPKDLENGDEFIDVPLLYTAATGNDFNNKVSKENIDKARRELKSLKNAFIRSITGKLPANETLSSYAKKYLNLSSSYFTSGDILENINDFKFVIKTKEFDKKFDTSYESTISDADQDGLISYIVAVDPESWDEENKDYKIKFTVAALPNVNNKNVPPKVKEALKKLHEKHKKFVSKNDADYSYVEIKEPEQVFTRISNVLLDKNKKYPTYTSFKTAHGHLNMSDPLIITDKSALDLVTSDDIDKQKLLNEINKGDKFDMNGKAVVFVSDDMSIKAEDLPLEYVKQVKAAKNPDIKLEDRKNSVRLVLLSPQGLPFSTWMNRNQTLLQKLRDNPDLVKSSERKALTNNYAAAKIIARLMTISEQHYSNKKAGRDEMWLPREIAYAGNQYSQDKVDAFVDKINKLLDVLIPGMFGKTYNELVIESLSGKPDKKTRERTLDPAELAAFMKVSENESKSDSLGYLIKNGVFNSATNAAKEHFLAGQLYKLLEDTTTPINVKMNDFLMTKEEDYNKFKESNDRTKTQSAMRNMVAALRVGFYGGRIFTDRDNNVKSSLITSIFEDKGTRAIDEKALQDFMGSLNLILTDTSGKLKPAVKNDKYVYKPLFPDGVLLDIAAKVAGEGFDPRVKPFVRPIDTSYDHLSVNVGISEPKYILNLTKVLNAEVKGGKKKISNEMLKRFNLFKEQLPAMIKEFQEEFKDLKTNQDTITNGLHELLGNLPEDNEKSIEAYFKANKIPEGGFENYILTSIFKIIENSVERGIRVGYPYYASKNFKLTEEEVTKNPGVNNVKDFVSSVLQSEEIVGMFEEYAKNNGLKIEELQTSVDLVRDDTFEVGIISNGETIPFLQINYITDRDSYTIDNLINSSELEDKIKNNMKKVKSLTDNRVIHEFVASLEAAQQRDTLLPVEQLQLAKDYLNVRTEIRTKVSENRVEIESLIKDIYKDIFTTKKC